MDSDSELGGLSVEPPPSSSEDNRDITQQFFEACRVGLASGELCHNSWFTLVHSMSAIEVMDPKMDIRVHGARRVITTTEALSTGTLPLEPFVDRAELMGVMDELLACTVNWLTGDSLDQSLFTCMYMHCTQLVRDPYLRAFCELLRRVVYQMRHIILGTGVFDEEDFYPSTHGMPLQGPNHVFNRFLDPQALPEAMVLFQCSSSHLIEHTRGLTESLRASHDDQLPAQTDLTEALAIRLEFLIQMLQFTDSLFNHMDLNDVDRKSPDIFGFEALDDPFKKDECKRAVEDDSSGTSLVSATDFWSSLSSVCSSLQPILIELNRLSSCLSATVDLGQRSGQGRLYPKDHAYGLPGFEPFLNQTSLPSYIPRFVIIHDRSRAFAYLCGLTARLLQITQTRLLVTKWQAFEPRNSAFHFYWSIIRQNGQTVHPHVVQLLNAQYGKTDQLQDASDFHSDLPSCLPSRALSCLLYFLPMRYFRTTHMPLDISSTFQVEMTIVSWLEFESKNYHEPLRSIIAQLPGFRGFLEILADHLIQIPRIYCLNRSRQRSALDQLLQKFPDLLGECWRAEWIMGIELAKLLGLSEDNTSTATSVAGPENTDEAAAASKPPFSVPLHLSAYACYYYYQLTWDYLVTGFQLELYAAHEWVFIYTFMIQLFQNTSALLERFLAVCSDLDTAVASATKALESGAAPPNPKSSAKGKKSKKRTKTRPGPSETNNNEEKPEISPPLRLCGPGSELEYLVLKCHQFLTVATMYALRALQLDTGGDLTLDHPSHEDQSDSGTRRFGRPEEIYARRLGIFLAPANSPLCDQGGCAGAFHACKQYLTSGVFAEVANASTTELYKIATRNFENAQFRAQLAQVSKAPMVERITRSTGLTLPDDLSGQLFGTPDRLADLERLATHNVIACRVLANCPDRRPTGGAARTSLATPSFLLRSSPVQLDFSFLTSRTYPLIRLVSPQPDSDKT